MGSASLLPNTAKTKGGKPCLTTRRREGIQGQRRQRGQQRQFLLPRRRQQGIATTTTTTTGGRGRGFLGNCSAHSSSSSSSSSSGSRPSSPFATTATPGAKVDAALRAVGEFLRDKFAAPLALLDRLGLTRKEAWRKQAGNFSMMASVGSLTSKFCVYDPTPTTPVDTFILLCKALANFLAFYTLILFVRVLLTWFPNIDWDKNPWLTLRQITDPYLNIFRNMVPPLMGQIDLTPIVGFLVMQYITSFIKFLGNRFISIDNFSDGWGGVFFFEDEDMLAGLFEDQNAAPTAPPA